MMWSLVTSQREQAMVAYDVAGVPYEKVFTPGVGHWIDPTWVEKTVKILKDRGI